MSKVSLNAYKMVESVVFDSLNKGSAIKNFLKIANETNTQGKAIVSYYSQAQKLSQKNKFLKGDSFDRYCRLPELIEKEVEKNFEIEIEAKKFSEALKKNYPKTIDKRISLAYHGAVVDDKVEPKSIFKRFWVIIDNLMT